MHLIHPTASMGANLFHESQFFLASYPVETLTIDESIALIHQMIDDSMSRRMIWSMTSINLERFLEKHLDWWLIDALEGGSGDMEDTPPIRLAQHYYTEVIDRYYLHVEEFLDAYVGNRTWDVWYMLNMGGDTVLERGADYRILEFDRKVLSGEWKLEEHIRRKMRR